MKVAEKSRRIGLSWADAADAALVAALSSGESTWYLGYNREMSEQYITDVAFWAKAFGIVASSVEEFVFDDEGSDILAFRVRFASGHKVTALSSRPSNLRAKKGRIRIDEAAFHDDLGELLKSAIAILMWGGSVAIWSTHNGNDNPFNQLVQQIKSGQLAYSLHTITLDDAVSEGLYQRICLVRGEPWSQQQEQQWRSGLYRDYGVAASEELDCQPFSARAGKVFNIDWFEIVDTVPSGGQIVRFWDLAATSAEVAKGAFFTAGVKMKKVNGIYYVLDGIAEQLSPAAANKLIVSTAQDDTANVQIRWELEGGSAGKRDEQHLRSLLSGFDAAAVKPLGDKVTRAKPFGSEAMRGNVKLLRGDWNSRYLNAIHQFDGTSKPLVNDFTDASSGAYNELSRTVVKQLPPHISFSRW